MSERLTPEREKEIRESIREIHHKFSKFKDTMMMVDLLNEIDALRSELSEIKDDSVVYQKFQKTEKERDRLKTVLRTEIHNDTVNKMLKHVGEK